MMILFLNSQEIEKNRYFVATQDPELREKCRKVPGTPILYLHHSAPVLEKPSDMSENQAQNTLEARMTGKFVIQGVSYLIFFSNGSKST